MGLYGLQNGFCDCEATLLLLNPRKRKIHSHLLPRENKLLFVRAMRRWYHFGGYIQWCYPAKQQQKDFFCMSYFQFFSLNIQLKIVCFSALINLVFATGSCCCLAEFTFSHFKSGFAKLLFPPTFKISV